MNPLRDHVVRLARHYEVNVYESDLACRRGKGASLPGAVVCPTVTDAESYCICLHEFGHLQHLCAPDHRQTAMSPVGTTLTSDGRTLLGQQLCLTCELAAWTWARAHALTWDAAMEAVLRTGLLSYWIYLEAGDRARLDTFLQE